MKHLFSFFSLSVVWIENYCECQTSLCYIVREPLCFSIFPIVSLFIFNRLQYLDLRRVFSFFFLFFWKITTTRLCTIVQWNFTVYVLHFRIKYLLTWKKDGLQAIFTKNSLLLRTTEANPSSFIIIIQYLLNWENIPFGQYL